MKSASIYLIVTAFLRRQMARKMSASTKSWQVAANAEAAITKLHNKARQASDNSFAMGKADLEARGNSTR